MGKNKKRAVIIGASRMNKTVLKAVNITENDLLICCDGGYKHCIKYGIVPDVLIGDFDSYDKSLVPKGQKTIVLNEKKDDTDTIYAVRYAINSGCDDIALLGVLGGRPDHTFASFQTLLFVNDMGGKAIIYDNLTTAFLLCGGSVTVPHCKKSYLSIFSMSEKCEKVSISNSKFDVSDVTLYNHFPLGVSNDFNEDGVTISLEKGKLLIMITPKRG